MEMMDQYNLKPVRKTCSRIGLALSVIFIVASVFQILWSLAELFFFQDTWLTQSTWSMWLGNFIPLYVIAVPIGFLIFRKIPANPPEENKLRPFRFIEFLLIGFFLMYSGNIVGNILSTVLSGGNAENALTEYANDTNPLKFVVIVVAAPLIEEFIFRKLIIDRTRIYGEKVAIFLSAITFGLFHMNLFQFFYAFLLGWIFAYIYIRTGRLRYSILMHAIINFMGSVVAPFILSLVDMQALNEMAYMDPMQSTEELLSLYSQVIPGLLLLIVYALVLMGMSVAGLILLIVNRKELTWRNADAQLPKGTAFKSVYINIGMIVFILICFVMIGFSLFLT